MVDMEMFVTCSISQTVRHRFSLIITLIVFALTGTIWLINRPLDFCKVKLGLPPVTLYATNNSSSVWILHNSSIVFCRLKPRSHSRECALIANVNGYSSICSVIRHSRTTENKSRIQSTFLWICYSQFIRTINSFMWTLIRRLQKFINTKGIVFVYIFKAISFAGHLNEYLQFACLQQLIRCFLFANVNESL